MDIGKPPKRVFMHFQEVHVFVSSWEGALDCPAVFLFFDTAQNFLTRFPPLLLETVAYALPPVPWWDACLLFFGARVSWTPH